MPEDVEAVFIGLILRKQKWLLCGTYHPTHTHTHTQVKKMNTIFVIWVKGLTLPPNMWQISFNWLFQCWRCRAMFVTIFFFYHDTNNLVNGKTCFKCKNNPSCIEIFVTNSCNSFQNTSAITTGLSDSHKMVVIVLKTTFLKSKPRVITYRDYRSFDLDTFKADLKNFLRVRNVSSHLMSEEIFLHVLQRHTQVK